MAGSASGDARDLRARTEWGRKLIAPGSVQLHGGAGGRPRPAPALSAPFPQALFTACRLKVFDLLSDGEPRGAADVARAVDASVCGTRRLLEVCVALGLLRKTEQGDRRGLGGPWPVPGGAGRGGRTGLSWSSWAHQADEVGGGSRARAESSPRG